MPIFKKLHSLISPSARNAGKGTSNSFTPRQETAFRIYHLLQMQKMLFHHGGTLPEAAKSDKAIGYILGYTDAICQYMEVPDEDYPTIGAIVFSLAFEDDQEAERLFVKVLKGAKFQSGPIYEGIEMGGSEIRKYIGNRNSAPQPMGWWAIATGHAV